MATLSCHRQGIMHTMLARHLASHNGCSVGHLLGHTRSMLLMWLLRTIIVTATRMASPDVRKICAAENSRCWPVLRCAHLMDSPESNISQSTASPGSIQVCPQAFKQQNDGLATITSAIQLIDSVDSGHAVYTPCQRGVTSNIMLTIKVMIVLQEACSYAYTLLT